MKDLFREYKQKVRKDYIVSGLIAGIFAFSINVFLQPMQTTGPGILASVYQLESASMNISTIDVTLTKKENTLNFHANNPMLSVSTLRAIIVHNPDTVHLGTGELLIQWAVITEENKNLGMTEVKITFKNPMNIKTHTELIRFPILKEKSGEPINIIETDFTASGKTYLLTNSWTRL